MAKLSSLKDLYIEELQDIHSAETQAVQAYPTMMGKVTSPELKAAFTEHLQQTQTQVQRLEQILGKLGADPNEKQCRGMAGILAEAKELMSEDADPEVLDAGILAQAQHMEHYEMAAYGSVIAHAKQIGENDAVQLLQTTLDEEKQTDAKLTKIAESKINKQAQ